MHTMIAQLQIAVDYVQGSKDLAIIGAGLFVAAIAIKGIHHVMTSDNRGAYGLVILGVIVLLFLAPPSRALMMDMGTAALEVVSGES